MIRVATGLTSPCRSMQMGPFLCHVAVHLSQNSLQSPRREIYTSHRRSLSGSSSLCLQSKNPILQLHMHLPAFFKRPKSIVSGNSNLRVLKQDALGAFHVGVERGTFPPGQSIAIRPIPPSEFRNAALTRYYGWMRPRILRRLATRPNLIDLEVRWRRGLLILLAIWCAGWRTHARPMAEVIF